jgi:cytochrome c-type biogenesis protein CcmH/NrfF
VVLRVAFAMPGAVAIAAPGADAGSTEQDLSWAYAMAHDLMSPFCPGRTLAQCPSPKADELRQRIVSEAAAGRAREDIEQSLFQLYGDVILSTPRASGGWGLSAYVIPIAGFMLGGVAVLLVLRRLVQPRGSPPPGPPAAGSGSVDDSELEHLVDQELARD